MEKIILGIVPAPGLTATVSEKLREDMEEMLNHEFSIDLDWEIKIKIDQITGAAENAKEIINQAIHIKEKNN